ncbi:MAG: hypothetical protein LBM02_03820 [Lachnospiraceae bacterium]|jgi:hypothetical protein|nr:hypothetical protein [Lachnospiraceae bacterium]
MRRKICLFIFTIILVCTFLVGCSNKDDKSEYKVYSIFDKGGNKITDIAAGQNLKLSSDVEDVSNGKKHVIINDNKGVKFADVFIPTQYSVKEKNYYKKGRKVIDVSADYNNGKYVISGGDDVVVKTYSLDKDNEDFNVVFATDTPGSKVENTYKTGNDKGVYVEVKDIKWTLKNKITSELFGIY